MDLPDSVYYDGAQTDYAVRRLAELKDAGQPFFFAVGYYRPHLPFNAPQKYWDLYDPASLPLADNQFVPDGAPLMAVNTNKELRGYTDFRTAPEPNQGPLNVAGARRLTHGYYAAISYVDAQVGRLLDRLDSLGLTDNTIVVLWGDHGYKLGEHNGWAKFTNYDIDTHAPLIIRAPGRIPPGLRLPQMVEFVDIYPTLAELAGLPVPAAAAGRERRAPLSATRAGLERRHLQPVPPERHLGGTRQHSLHGLLHAHPGLPLRGVDELEHPAICGVGVIRPPERSGRKRQPGGLAGACNVARAARGGAAGRVAGGGAGAQPLMTARSFPGPIAHTRETAMRASN